MLLAALTGFAGAVGLFAADPLHRFGMGGAPRPVAAVLISGDTGLHSGLGSAVAPAMAARGIPVLGVNSPSIFGVQRSQADVDRLLAGWIDTAMAETGASRVILIGHSFGADIIASGLAHLAPEQRRHVAAIVLLVPGKTAFFRADPFRLRYFGTPDAEPAHDLRAIDWAPLICLYGARETDSLCPSLIGAGATVLELPGGHLLDRDHKAVTEAIFTALHTVDPAIGSVTKASPRLHPTATTGAPI